MNLQEAILTFNSCSSPASKEHAISKVDSRALLIVTLLYLVLLLAVPIFLPGKIIWFAIYPIVMSPLCGFSYSSVFKKSLYVLPFVMLIGVFNPIFDNRPAFVAGDIEVSFGWLSFLSLTLRGLMAVQALLILLRASGFLSLCHGFHRMGFPSVLITQLLMLYRFIGILMEESLTLKRAVAARGYGKSSFPIRLWARILGALMLRTLDRASRVYNAMSARNFSGHFHVSIREEWNGRSSLFAASWTIIFFFLYFFDLSSLFMR
ncbi:MAG: cobalt ECF transporter T component CbiQ [Muribaculaceae bacterium]|nr:cobalt ECF transporter T component CbiQ [Muribaculaceae bacterium]